MTILSSSFFVEVDVTPEMYNVANTEAKRIGKLKNSILSGEGNLTGCIGDVATHYYYEGSILAWTRHYDVLVNGVKIDVKTKLTKVFPLLYYDCSIAAFNTKQECDLYLFARVNREFTKVWLLGCYPKEFYFRDARFLREGDADGDNGFKVKADCYNMKVDQLIPVPK